MIKIIITDDHPLMLDGLKKALIDESEIKILGTYSNARQLMQGIGQAQPDILLLDIQLPDRNGNELVPLLLQKYPELNIIILTSLESTQLIREMMQIGCKGFLLKSVSNQEKLLDAVFTVNSGQIYIDESVKSQLLIDLLVVKRKANKLKARITQREQEILNMVALNLSSQEIADKLFISLRTVETHRYNLFQKLNAKNSLQLVQIAEELKLLGPFREKNNG